MRRFQFQTIEQTSACVAGQYKVTRRGAGLAALVREALGEAVAAGSPAVAGLMAGAVRDIASLLAAPPPSGPELQVQFCTAIRTGIGRWELVADKPQDLSRSLCGSAVTDMAAASCRSSATHERPETEPRCLDIHKRADAALALSDMEQYAMLTSNAAHVAQLTRSAATADARHLRLHCEHRHHTPAAGHIEG